jgi:precorrin-8X/cobalt-precorrin-8 methylmutase
MILVLAGTSDARELALEIKRAGYSLLTTVVTENAANGMKDVGLDVRVGRLTAEEIASIIKEKGFQAVVDASHPFAEEASKNALTGAKAANVPYIRYERESQSYQHEGVTLVDSYEEAASVAATKRGVIMLTTGSKTLATFVDKLIELPDTTVVARMLPRLDNMQKCEDLGLEQKNIVAMQGPFSKELNKALYAHYKVDLMITKESGKVGAVDEKLEAALEMGIEVLMIGRPKVEYGTVFSDFPSVIKQLKEWEEIDMDFGTEFKPFTVQPQEIEGKSFEMITEELGEHSFTEEQYPVVQRVIHASADFELGRSMLFHPHAIQAGIHAIRSGKVVVADVQMVQVGISKNRIEQFGGEIKVYISDPDVMKEAKRLNTTRAIVSMRKAIKDADGGIFAIGNAPTALLELIRLVKRGEAKPGLVIGLPVGFVSAAESKEELAKLDIPFITNVGRKGGSTVTVAALNAISLLAEQV